MKSVLAAVMVALCLGAGGARCRAAAPDFEFHAPASPAGPAAAAAMRDLAQRILPVYQEPDPDRYLDNLSVLQMAVGDFAAAYGSRQSLRSRRRPSFAHPLGQEVTFDIYAYARTLEAERKIPFADAFTQAFTALVPGLADRDANAVAASLERSPQPFESIVHLALDRQRAMDDIGQQDAVALIWKYVEYRAYLSFAPLVAALDSAEQQRRYATDDGVRIKTADGAVIRIVVVRPRNPPRPLAALLEFTIYDSANAARECAAHGYAGVVAHTRDAGGGTGGARRPLPFQHDGDDARAVINWIARQSWSDGRVAMYGDGYSGFTPWSAAARRPRALKAIATTMPMAPGIDFPMSGGIFQNAAFAWSARLTGAAPEAAGGDEDSWRSLDQRWYRSGRPYRDLGRLSGRPNPIFMRWLNHPSFDHFWQSMIPSRDQFAHIDIPVLTVTGYFAASEPAALHYFLEHGRANPHADHRLVIGPYDDGVAMRGPSAVLHGYPIDPAAVLDLHELRYQWFDSVLKGAPMPPLLKDRVNYEVMGANEWRHAPTLRAMSGGRTRFYLGGPAAGDAHRLAADKSPGATEQTLSYADRTDAGWTAPIDLITRSPAIHNALEFASEPLAAPVEFNGLFSGRLDFTVNKADADLNIAVYERLQNGDYLRLYDPTFELRASYARDRAHRRLLRAGQRQQIVFSSERMIGRRLQAGSRLVVILGIGKRPDREINYGTGGDVSAESMADGANPLQIRWYGDSYLEFPVRSSAAFSLEGM